MTALLAGWLTSSITLTGSGRMMLMFPLCLSVAVVYKTTRCDRLREVPLAAAALWVTIVVGMYAVGVGLWILFRVMI